MHTGAFGSQNSESLMAEYASLVGDAVLRHRTRVAEHTARIETELANKIKSEFISNMSHELRTPLNAVIGFSKLLADQNYRSAMNDGEVGEYAGLIHDAAVHLLSVINDILDISKMQSGKFTLDQHEVDLGQVLQECAQSARAFASGKSLVLKVKLPSELPVIRGERDKLAQVFNNVISNSMKFTDPGGLITIAAAENRDHSITVAISDNGIGMSAEEIEVALTPFGQVDGSRSRWQEGTGLGLTIAKALTELHGGELHIRSERERGTEVLIVLPSRHRAFTTQGRIAVAGAQPSPPRHSIRPPEA